MEPSGPLERGVVIALCRGAGEADLVRSLLESCGIPCLVGSDISRVAYPLTVSDLGDVRVSVPAAAAEEAVAILAASPQTAAPQNRPPLTLIDGGLSPKRARRASRGLSQGPVSEKADGDEAGDHSDDNPVEGEGLV